MNKGFALVAALVSIGVMLAGSQYPRYGHPDGVHMLVAGSGTPAVVFVNGLGPSLSYWQRVQSVVSASTTTLSYDRAGIGDSEAGPLPRDARKIAGELHAMLRNAQLPPPYVLVGHSIGGLYVRVFASLYPDEVAALVLVDPSRHDEVDAATVENSGYPELSAMGTTMRQARDAPLPAGIPVYLIMAMGARGEPYPVGAAEQQRLAAGRQADLEAHRAWVASLGNGHLVVTENSGHNVPIEEAALVIETIRQASAAAALD